MSSGERPVPLGRPPAAPTAAAGPVATTRNGAAPTLPHREAPLPAIPPAQQRILLAATAPLAQTSPHPTGASSTQRGRHVLSALLHGRGLAGLRPYQLEAVEPLDADLDAPQRDAVAKALNTPDVCLIQGLPGTGKSRVLAEVIRQAVRRGQRVLLTSPTAAAVDVVLERLDGDTQVLALRCLSRDERAEDLAPIPVQTTFAAYRRRLGDDAARQAKAAIVDFDGCVERLRLDEPRFDALVEIAERQTQIRVATDQVAADRASSAEEVRRLAESDLSGPANDEFLAALRNRRKNLQAKLDGFAQERRKAEAEWRRRVEDIAEIEAKRTRLCAQRDARGSWRLWSRIVREARKISDLPAQIAEKDAKLQAARLAVPRALADREWIEREAQQAEQDGGAAQEECVATEIARCERDCNERQAHLRAQSAELDVKWEETARALSPDAPTVVDHSPDAVAQARTRLRECQETALSQRELAMRWASYLSEHGQELPTRLLACVNVVAAPVSALATDDYLAEVSRRGPFDLLVLDDVHRLTENELLAAARRTARWLLVGEPGQGLDNGGETERADAGPRDHASRRSGAPSRSQGRAPAPQRSLLHKLWQALDGAIWRNETGRIVCQLQPLTADERRQVVGESVADRPDVELHFLKSADGSPVLAEVVFAAGTSIENAKTFVYRELNELPTPAAASHWESATDQSTLRFSSSEATSTVELEPGVREHFRAANDTWHTVALEFDGRAGWTRVRAEEWVHRHVRSAGLGRTAQLRTPHRLPRAVAEFVCRACFEGVYACGAVSAAPAANGIEFVPVPALTGETAGRRRDDFRGNGAPRGLALTRGGAGLETDLSDARQRERLPEDLRALLPERGFVNLIEADAVVELLETRLRAEATADPAQPLTVAVLPVYAAQAALIRRLIEASPVLARPTFPLTVAAAVDFGQRECDVVVLALTRSHTHRAVSYGDAPTAVPLALTRARKRVLVVGDAGTLYRRSQWDGALDHLDETAAKREKNWVAELVRWIAPTASAQPIPMRAGAPDE